MSDVGTPVGHSGLFYCIILHNEVFEEVYQEK